MSTPEPTTEREAPDLTGELLGDYRLLHRLGRGGMADVYLAEQVSLKRNVALKILKPELARDTSYVKRFEREAQAAAALVQANIVQIYEVGHVGGYYFIAQEYVRGRNLRQYLDRHGAVEPIMAVNVLRQCALALQKAHELGVVHRDIKPENIMLSTHGEVKITDFGLARVSNNRSDQALTQIGVTMGTPLYMSPEQVGGQSIDHRSDLYSLGVTAYHMLAGEPPFTGDNALSIAVQHVNDSPPSLAESRPDAPPELIAAITSMMAKSPRNRPTDARQLLRMLREIKLEEDADWEMIVEKLAVSEMAVGGLSTSWSEAQLAATRQLQQVLLGHRPSWWRSRPFALTLALLAAAGLLVGLYAARQTRPTSLLNVDNLATETIPRKASVEQQYDAARWRPPDEQERFYQAVIDYFPYAPNAVGSNVVQLYHRRAKARLAELYLTEERWGAAHRLFEEFVGYNEMQEAFRVTGYAGLAYVHLRRNPNDYDGGATERNQKIYEAVSGVDGRTEMLNLFMRERFDEVRTWLNQQQEPGPLEIPGVDTPPTPEVNSFFNAPSQLPM